MRTNWLFGLACVAAVDAAAFAQPAYFQTTPPPWHAAGAYVVQRDGSYLGIGVVDITSERAKSLNLKEEGGAEVTRVVDGGPAAKAGIKAGDVVVAYTGQAVQGIRQFQGQVRA